MYNKRKIEMIKQRYPEGTRICLDNMDNDPNPIPPGSKGTVQFVDDMGTVFCEFDNGRSLGVIPGEDSFHKIQQEEELTEELEESEDLSKEPELNMTMKRLS